MKVSVIVPTLGFHLTVKVLLKALLNQTVSIDEIILVDSSINNEVQSLCKEFEDSLPLKYFKVDGLFPGEARNFGIRQSNGEIIAILDSKTIPQNQWLEKGIKKLTQSNFDVVFGSTSYLADTKVQKIFQACIYGKDPVETTPGSIFPRQIFKKVGEFIEDTRTADDLEWRNRVKYQGLSFYSPSESMQTYDNISKSIFGEFKRSFIYQLHGAKLDVQKRARIVILGISIILITLLIPQWNNIVGWESSPLYIENITKSYFYGLSIFSLIILTISHKFNQLVRNIWFKFLTVSLFLLSSYLIYKWNSAMAGWVEDSIYFIPHITKIYLGTIIFCGICYRGLYVPLSRGISSRSIFPINWLFIGFVGFIIDLGKYPGYLIGAILGLLRLGYKQDKNNP